MAAIFRMRHLCITGRRHGPDSGRRDKVQRELHPPPKIEDRQMQTNLKASLSVAPMMDGSDFVFFLMA